MPSSSVAFSDSEPAVSIERAVVMMIGVASTALAVVFLPSAVPRVSAFFVCDLDKGVISSLVMTLFGT